MTEYHHDDHALRRLDEADLEVLRLRAVRDQDDERFEAILGHLVARAIPVVDDACRCRGAERKLSDSDIKSAIEFTWAQLLMRLRRDEPLPPVSAIAGDLATTSIEAQVYNPPAPARLVSRHPQLRVVRDDAGHHFNGNGRTT